MLRKPMLTLMLGLLLAGMFFAGVSRLFILRYESGDVYPPYSTLRSDPLGAKAIHDALGQLPGMNIQRNYKPLPKLKPPAPITLVYAGVSRYAMWDDRELLDFDALVLSGSRAIFTFFPIEHSPIAEEERRGEEQAREKKKQKALAEKKKPAGEKLGGDRKATPGAKDARNKGTGANTKDEKPGGKKPNEDGGKADEEKKSDAAGKAGKDDEELQKSRYTSFKDAARRWGFSFDFLPAREESAYHRTALIQETAPGLERQISWHTALYFKDLNPEWTVLYACENHPVIIERKFGAGSLVFAADSFFLSNEALRSERCPRLLARCFDGPPAVVFDEEHHDVREEPGMATLARKYRLHGVVAGLVLLTALFVWKNAVRFIPARSSGSDESGVVAGKESAEGFVNLLRRTVKPSEILGVCVAEWRRAFPHQPHEMAKIDAVFAEEQGRPARERNAVDAYQRICERLAAK